MVAGEKVVDEFLTFTMTTMCAKGILDSLIKPITTSLLRRKENIKTVWIIHLPWSLCPKPETSLLVKCSVDGDTKTAKRSFKCDVANGKKGMWLIGPVSSQTSCHHLCRMTWQLAHFFFWWLKIDIFKISLTLLASSLCSGKLLFFVKVLIKLAETQTHTLQEKRRGILTHGRYIHLQVLLSGG